MSARWTILGTRTPTPGYTVISMTMEDSRDVEDVTLSFVGGEIVPAGIGRLPHGFKMHGNIRACVAVMELAIAFCNEKGGLCVR